MAAITPANATPIVPTPMPAVNHPPEDSPRSSRARWIQIVRGETDASSFSHLPPPFSTASSSTSSSGIFEEENTENDTLPTPGSGTKKPAWNKPIFQSSASVIGGECWPALSESARVSSKPADSSSPALATQRSLKRNGNPQANGTVGDRPLQFRGNDNNRNTFRNRGTGRNDRDPNPRNFHDNMYPHRPVARFIRPPPPPPYVPISGPFMVPPPPVRPFGAPMAFPDYPMYYFPPPMPLYPGPTAIPAPAPAPVPVPAPAPAPAPAPVFVPSAESVLRSKILKQIDYYFSINNLCKDVYLRNHMDEQGWVSVRLIAAFKRVAALTDNVQVILEAMKGSAVVEVQGEKMRRRNDWMNWMMPMRRHVANSSVLEGMKKVSLEEKPSG